jgi:hypothetical protein
MTEELLTTGGQVPRLHLTERVSAFYATHLRLLIDWYDETLTEVVARHPRHRINAKARERFVQLLARHIFEPGTSLRPITCLSPPTPGYSFASVNTTWRVTERSKQ